ncbi:MAG: flavodoxin domain-containing protein [Verrucomicrobiota bacterium]
MIATRTPTIPESAPFDEKQRLWLNGYLAGLFNSGNGNGASPAPARPDLGTLLFLYGTQTGGAETLARRFAKEAEKKGFRSAVRDMDAFAEIDFSAEKRLAIITSTYGDGEMPDNAQAFWDFLAADSAPRLPHVEFSVLALGDTNYAKFCEAGKNFDVRLEALGARRVHPRVDCDVDFEDPAKDWFANFSSVFAPAGDSTSETATETPAATGFGKSNPFPAKLKANINLNQPGSAKETRHVEIVLEGSGLEYEAGDALGVMPRNCGELVAEVLAAAGLQGTENIAIAGAEATLRDALIRHFDLKPFLTALPAPGTAAEALVAPLKKIQPRLYSIASSAKAFPGEVHLTVGAVRYELDGKSRKGVCSTFLADFESRADEEKTVPVFVHRSPHFRVPAETSRPVIMVGPGTGIAPFRAFLQERKAAGGNGKNWLFFGDQRSAFDFLYEDELKTFLVDGVLTRLDLAFSRDQEEKVYVQDRIRAAAAEMWQWFEDGAYFYICGDASRMAKDVEKALLDLPVLAGALNEEAAAAWLVDLKKQKRYLRDVY